MAENCPHVFLIFITHMKCEKQITKTSAMNRMATCEFCRALICIPILLNLQLFTLNRRHPMHFQLANEQFPHNIAHKKSVVCSLVVKNQVFFGLYSIGIPPTWNT